MNCGGIKCVLNSLGLLAARAAVGSMMVIGHGWGKLAMLKADPVEFADPFGWGPRTSLILCIVGEVVAPAMIALGLFTRPAALGAAFTMGVAAFHAHAADPLFIPMGGGRAKELALLYMIPFALFFFTGPGKLSVDALIFRRKAAACAATSAGSATSATQGAAPRPETPGAAEKPPRNMI